MVPVLRIKYVLLPAVLWVVVLALLTLPVKLRAQNIGKYNLSFNSPAIGAASSMVLGNGDISANVWIDKSDQCLYFYIGKTDSRDYLDRQLKVGKIKVQFQPNILDDESIYHQEFHLDKSIFTVHTPKGNIRFWVDANNPVIVLDAQTTVPVKATITTQIWRRQDHVIPSNKDVQIGDPLFKCLYKEMVEADSTVKGRQQDIIFYHRNQRSTLFDVEMNMFRLSQKEFPNPYRQLVFGAIIAGTNMLSENDSMIVSATALKKIEIRTTVLTHQFKNTNDWIKAIESKQQEIREIPADRLLKNHCQWWNNFWNQSYIGMNTDTQNKADSLYDLTRTYLYQRYLLAICGKGASPIHFNGGTYTVDSYTYPIKTTVGTLQGESADSRLWGYSYLWQNTRLLYWPMLESGDYNMIRPLLQYYCKVVYPKALDFTKNFKRKPGVSFEELYHSWGTVPLFIYGMNRAEDWNGNMLASEASLAAAHLNNHISCGLELVNYMLDYFDFTQDTAFLKSDLLPIAKEVVTFFDKGHPRDKGGKLLMEGYKSLETYNNVTNPVVYIAGLRFILPRLQQVARQFKMNDFATDCERFYSELPPLSFYNENGTMILAPGKSFDSIRTNIEQPELYPVYPFRLFGVGKKDIQTGINTFNTPSNYGTVFPGAYNIGEFYNTPFGTGKRQIFDWNQTGIQAAHLGLKDAAWQIMSRSGFSRDSGFRFPCFFGYNTYNFLPDTEHGAVFMKTLQSMLIQSERDSIYLFPAWPGNRDVKFKLHAMRNTVVEAELKKGKLVLLKVFPESRRKDIVLLLK